MCNLCDDLLFPPFDREIWASATARALMPILNERVVPQVENVPLKTAYMASGELRDDVDYGEFWDRVIERTKRGYLEPQLGLGKSAFITLVSQPKTGCKTAVKGMNFRLLWLDEFDWFTRADERAAVADIIRPHLNTHAHHPHA